MLSDKAKIKYIINILFLCSGIHAQNFTYDSLKKTNPSQFPNYFHYQTTTNTAANRQGDLAIPQVRTTTYGLKSIKYTGSLIWNNLPNHTKQLPSKKIFNKAVKKHFVNSYI